mgnify:CR=1 FL=1
MKNNFLHVTSGHKQSDPFVPSERSKTTEHTDRLRSDFCENSQNENLQKSIKNED